jgi:hypothetical protein
MAGCDNTRFPEADDNANVSTQRQILYRQTDGVCYAHALINSVLVTPVRELLAGHLATRVSKMTTNDVAFCENAISVMMSWSPGRESMKLHPRLRRNSYANITKAMLLAFLRKMAETDADDFVVDHGVGRNPQVDIFFIFCAQKFQSLLLKKDVRNVEVIGERADQVNASFFKLLELCDVELKRNGSQTECIFDGGSLLVVTGDPPVTGGAIDCKCVGGLLLSTAARHATAYSVVGERIRVFDSNFAKPYDLCDFVMRYKAVIPPRSISSHTCRPDGPDAPLSQLDVLTSIFDNGWGASTTYYVRKNPHSGGMLKTFAASASAARFHEPELFEPAPANELYACLMSLALAKMVDAPVQGGGGRRYANYALAAIVAAMAVFGA